MIYALAFYTTPVLCEVCTVLQALMVLDQPLDDEAEEGGEKDNEFGRLHIRQLLQMVLQDAQTRILQGTSSDSIRRLTISHTQISSLVGRLSPSLFCPVFLKMGIAAQGAQTQYENREKESISRLFEGPGLNQRETWFPTLSKQSGCSHSFTTMFRQVLFHYTVTIHKP
jgi:hypothetical protein